MLKNMLSLVGFFFFQFKKVLSQWLREVAKISVHYQHLCTKPCFAHVCAVGVSRIHRTGHVDEWRLTTVEETEDWPVMSPSDELDTTAHDMMQCICFRRGCRYRRRSTMSLYYITQLHITRLYITQLHITRLYITRLHITQLYITWLYTT